MCCGVNRMQFWSESTIISVPDDSDVATKRYACGEQNFSLDPHDLLNHQCEHLRFDEQKCASLQLVSGCSPPLALVPLLTAAAYSTQREGPTEPLASKIKTA